MTQPSILGSLSGRLLLFGVVPAIVGIAAIVVLTAIDEFHLSRNAEEQALASDVGSAATELSLRNERWNAFAQTLALSQSSGLFGRRAESIEFVRGVNMLSDLNLSMYFAYEPNADGLDAESVASGKLPASAMDGSGRFIPTWFDEYISGVRTGQTKLKPMVGMESLPYYQEPKDRFAASGFTGTTVTEPYIKEGMLLISHVSPIVIDGEFKGVAGVNRSLDILDRIAGTIKARSDADVFILGPTGIFIASTTSAGKSGAESLNDRPIAETPYAPIASRWMSTGAGEAGLFEAVDPELGVNSLYAVAKAETGGWTVIARRPMSEVMRTATASVTRNTLLGAAAILLVGGLLLVVTRRVAGRVRVAAAAADRIARGDLTERVPESTVADETGELMRSMRTMDGNLNALVGDVKQAGIRLNSTATEIAATSKQQEASTATFGAASNQIAAAVKEISTTGQDLVRTMESVSRIADETAQLAASGRTGLEGMEAVIQDLDAGTRSIGDKLAAINDRSQKITTVITTISKVADQTNILSINAAIEAEKAGEFGAGFLVIAREIRRLADQTASATLDIEQMVQQMQSAVSSGVMEMDRFSDQVRRGVRDVATVGTQLTEIINRVNSSTESFKQVNESMQAQSEGAHQISDAMGSLVGNAKQTAQSAQEFGRAAGDLQAAIATLREAVAQFRLVEST